MSRSKVLNESIKQLQGILLQHNLWTNEDFYNEKFKEVEEKKAYGLTDRVKHLKEVLARTKTMKKIQRTASIDHCSLN